MSTILFLLAFLLWICQYELVTITDNGLQNEGDVGLSAVIFDLLTFNSV